MKSKCTLNEIDRVRKTQVFAEIELSAKTINRRGIFVNYKDLADERWHAAVLFGANYAWEHIPSGGVYQGIDVTVFYIDSGHELRSSLAVAYVSSLCVLDALNIHPKRKPEFNLEKFLFEFPIAQL